VLEASDGVRRDDVVGKTLETLLDDATVGIDINRIRLPVLAMHIGENNRVVAVHVNVSNDEELNGHVSVTNILEIIVVQRIVSDLAGTLRAVGSRVTCITVAAHGHIFVPQTVDILVVRCGQLLDGIAGTVSRAHACRRGRTSCTLTSGAFVTRETGAITFYTVTNTFVRALAVVVRSVGQHISRTILHGRELLRGALRIHGAIRHHIYSWSGQSARRCVQVTKWSVDMCQAERTDAL